MIAYDSYNSSEMINKKTYKTEEERLDLLKISLSDSYRSYSALVNGLPKNKIETLKLKYKALRNSEVCAKFITLDPQFLDENELDMAWQIVSENPKACTTIIKHFGKIIKTEKYQQYKQQLIECAILYRENIIPIFNFIDEKDRLNILKQLVNYESCHGKFFAGYFNSFSSILDLDSRQIIFDLILKSSEASYDIAINAKLSGEELKTIFKKYGEQIFNEQIEEFNDMKWKDKNFYPFIRFFNTFKDLVTLKQERYLIKKLKTKSFRHAIDSVIDRCFLNQRVIDELKSFQLAHYLINN